MLRNITFTSTNEGPVLGPSEDHCSDEQSTRWEYAYHRFFVLLLSFEGSSLVNHDTRFDDP